MLFVSSTDSVISEQDREINVIRANKINLDIVIVFSRDVIDILSVIPAYIRFVAEYLISLLFANRCSYREYSEAKSENSLQNLVWITHIINRGNFNGIAVHKSKLSLPGQVVQVHVAAGENNANFFAGKINFLIPYGSQWYGAGGFDDDLHPLPNGPHITDNRFL